MNATISKPKQNKVYKMTLGEQFTVRLKRAGVTKNKLRELTGLSLPTIRRIFNDDKNVSIEKVDKVASALGCRIKYTLEV